MLLTAFLFLFKNNSSSQNLISNGSFENYTEDVGTSHCVTNFSSMFNWQQIQSPDVYTSFCTFSNHYGVPSNRNGIAYPINGNAYAGIVCFYKTLEVKEYIYQHLNTPLLSGKSYYVSFYVSRADRIEYAIKKLGAYLSINQPSVASSNTWIPVNPQIQNQTGFLTDTIGWIKIEGYFKAQGGEEYITIGNFNSNINSDTIYVGTTNPVPFDDGSAYYYIDSVSLYDSLDYVTGLHDIKKTERFSLFPNPNNGSFNLEYKINTEAEFVITDVTGRLINHYILFPSQNNLPIKEEELTAGVYFYYIRQNNQLLKQNKFVVIK